LPLVADVVVKQFAESISFAFHLTREIRMNVQRWRPSRSGKICLRVSFRRF
jgi:hypothetical protein